MVTKLCDIKPGDSDLTIRARVCRVWRGKLFFDVEKYDGLQCVLVDRNNNAIHAFASEADYDDVEEVMKSGVIYEITNFHATKNQNKYIVVPHEAMLMFTNRTAFEVVPEVYPPYPHYWFQFVDFNELRKRKAVDTYLSDVIGRIDSIYGVEDVPIDQDRIAPKRSIIIQDLRGSKLTVNLWGSMAQQFDVDAVQREMYPVVLAVSSTKVRTFDAKINVSNGMSTCLFINPSIHETEEFRRKYVGPQYAPKIMTDAPKRQGKVPFDASTANLITIKSLNKMRAISEEEKKELDQKGVSFFIEGTITKIVCRQGWYYMGCPDCLKQTKVQSSSGRRECSLHPEAIEQPMYKLQVRAEDVTDSVTLMAIGKGGEYLFGVTCAEALAEEGGVLGQTPPKALMRLMGEKRVLEVVHGTRNDFVVKSAHPAINGAPGQPSNVPTPEKKTSKRSSVIIEEGNTNILPSQETPKKQKSNLGYGGTGSKKAVQKFQAELQSEEEGELTLSELFNQQLQEKKKSSGQAAKALVIGKKPSEQSTMPPVVPTKQSERIKSKNKGKME